MALTRGHVTQRTHHLGNRLRARQLPVQGLLWNEAQGRGEKKLRKRSR